MITKTVQRIASHGKNRFSHCISISFVDHAFVGSPFKACVINPDRVAPVGGWLALFDGQAVVKALVNRMQLVEFETCQAGHGT